MVRVGSATLLAVLLTASGFGAVLGFLNLSPPDARHSASLILRSAATRPLERGLATPKDRLEEDLYKSIQGLSRRETDNSADTAGKVAKAVLALEAKKDSTSSPIQRAFIGNQAFTVYQEIDLVGPQPFVDNVVDFGKFGELRVQALASTAARPLPGFTPRRGDGLILGLPIFGVSRTEPPADPTARIDFKFDQAGFDLSVLPFKVPYPVPFRLLGDDVKGWLDITYLSPGFRVARGNKGTIFVLQKVIQ